MRFFIFADIGKTSPDGKPSQ